MNQRIMLTKSLLKSKLYEMLKSESLHNISVKELCELSGINRSTFYKHYKDQYDLFDDFQNDFIERMGACTHSERVKKGNRFPTTELLYLINEHIELAKLFFLKDPNGNFFTKLMANTDMRESIMVHLDHVPEKHREYYHLYISAGTQDLVCRWLIKDKRESPEFLGEIFIEMCKRCTEKDFV